jgi:hypothetical protein
MLGESGHIYIKNLDNGSETTGYQYPFYDRHGGWLKGIYSPDGSMLACYNYTKIFIMHIDRAVKQMLFEKDIWAKNQPNVQAIAFHPDGTIIAALLDKMGVTYIDYWNIKDKRRITSTPVPTQSAKIIYNLPKVSYSISFSPDGNTLIITMNNKCFSVEVPSEVIHYNDVEEQSACSLM